MALASWRRGRVPRLSALALAVAVLAAGSLLVPPAPARAEMSDTARIDTADPIVTAVELSQLAFPAGARTALLTRVDLFADGLSSGGAQGAVRGPLLVTPSDRLADPTRAELVRLGVERVIVLGGGNAIADPVLDDLGDAGY